MSGNTINKTKHVITASAEQQILYSWKAPWLARPNP